MIGEYLRFRDRFAAALDPKRYTIGYLDSLIVSGAVQILSTERAAILFRAKPYPTGATDVEGVVAAGELDDIVNELIPKAEEWGRRHGCLGALVESRPGWSRVLEKHGYSTDQVAVRKVL